MAVQTWGLVSAQLVGPTYYAFVVMYMVVLVAVFLSPPGNDHAIGASLFAEYNTQAGAPNLAIPITATLYQIYSS